NETSIAFEPRERARAVFRLKVVDYVSSPSFDEGEGFGRNPIGSRVRRGGVEIRAPAGQGPGPGSFVDGPTGDIVPRSSTVTGEQADELLRSRVEYRHHQSVLPWHT